MLWKQLLSPDETVSRLLQLLFQQPNSLLPVFKSNVHLSNQIQLKLEFKQHGKTFLILSQGYSHPQPCPGQTFVHWTWQREQELLNLPSKQRLCTLVCSHGGIGELKMKSHNGLLLSCRGRYFLSPQLSSYLASHPAPDFSLTLSWHFAEYHCTRSWQRVALTCGLFLSLMGKLV